MQGELELGDHAEVTAAAAQRPEQVHVLVRRSPQDPAVRGHDLCGHQAVDGQAEAAHQAADAAAEGEAAHAGVADHAGRDHQAVPLGGAVDVTEQRPAADGGTPRDRIHGDPAELAQVDHGAVVAGAVPRHRVPAAADRDRQPPARAKATAAATSGADRGRAISAGLRSCMAFQMARAAS